ncbi:MAG: patatin-like phospholipase family protein, partial [Pseudomonadota bacterium]|nr:patatin-like phospholipase family protein [Pseudomonadota bacterium]
MKKAIFLAGGGARGAYQAGALRCISEILGDGPFPTEILSTVSAGAINGSHLAMHAENFKLAALNLVELWSTLTVDKVYRAGNLDLISSVARNVANVVFHLNTNGSQHLLDTEPLRKLLSAQLDFERINQNIQNGLLSAFEVATTCFESSQTISFVHAQNPSLGWRKIRHHSQSTQINCNHIMASAAFPLFFPVVDIGDLHYGDGGLRHAAPLRASIKLGAEAILIIGTRRTPPIGGIIHPKPIPDINFAKIFGSLFNAFLDNLDRDLEHVDTINQNY